RHTSDSSIIGGERRGRRHLRIDRSYGAHYDARAIGSSVSASGGSHLQVRTMLSARTHTHTHAHTHTHTHVHTHKHNTHTHTHTHPHYHPRRRTHQPIYVFLPAISWWFQNSLLPDVLPYVLQELFFPSRFSSPFAHSSRSPLFASLY